MRFSSFRQPPLICKTNTYWDCQNIADASLSTLGLDLRWPCVQPVGAARKSWLLFKGTFSNKLNRVPLLSMFLLRPPPMKGIKRAPPKVSSVRGRLLLWVTVPIGSSKIFRMPNKPHDHPCKRSNPVCQNPFRGLTHDFAKLPKWFTGERPAVSDVYPSFKFTIQKDPRSRSNSQLP